MVVLVTCKNGEDPIKNKDASGHNIKNQFLRRSMAANSILKKYKLIQAFIVALLICKYEEDPFKIESTRLVTTDLPLKVVGDFSRR